MVFNHQSRKKNILRSSMTSVICRVISMILGFGYRILFLQVLTINHLGINGLFTNILGLLSLAELGITDAIVYRFYDPISNDDVGKVGKLMRFFKKTYLIIASVIMIIGMLIMPFLRFLIKDADEIPQGVNLYIVYLLFLIQTASTYLFSYKLTLLVADQKQYQNMIINTLTNVARYLVQIIVLFATRDYTMTLFVGIAITIVLNWLASVWVTKRYEPVFDVKDDLTKNEKTDIYHDTYAAMMHKIGGTVLNSTDNILLTKFIGLAITGIYSNYSLILTSISSIINMAFSSFTASFGNASVTLEKDRQYSMYKKSLLINLWIAGVTTLCVYMLISDFIFIWLGKPLFLDSLTVLFLCIQFYMISARYVSTSYTMACGLFTRDKARPIIEAFLNLIISVVALKYLGVAGIFLGTILSCGVTSFWREPYLLYRYVFEKNVIDYWITYVKNAVVVIIAALCAVTIKKMFAITSINLFLWIGEAIICVMLFLIIHFMVFCRNKEFIGMLGQIRDDMNAISGNGDGK